MGKKVDLLLDVIHPFVKDLTDVLKKHAKTASELGENEKISYLQVIDEITAILIDAYKKEVIQNATQNIEISSFIQLINIYLSVGSVKVKKEVITDEEPVPLTDVKVGDFVKSIV